MSHPYTGARILGSLPPPPGQKANFADPVNHDTQMIALHTVCLTIVTLFVGMRVCVRAFELHQFGLDDGKWIGSAMYANSWTHRLTSTDFLSGCLGEKDDVF